MDKVCILAAGRGSRVSYDAPKALLPVNQISVLSHIISWFPEDTEFVIAVGHQAQKIKDFVALVHHDKDIRFVDVDNYAREGSGPGYSLLSCKPYLMCPFYFVSSDTLVENPIPPLDRNFIGVAKVASPEEFLTVESDSSGNVTRLVDKEPSDGTFRRAFIGLAGVYNYEEFWTSLEGNEELKAGERQVSNGLEGLIPLGLDTFLFKWHDTGTVENYRKALEHYNEFSFLPKPGEFLYFEQGKVIKYFGDEELVTNRIKRAKILGPVVPRILGAKKNFYSYKYVSGERISHIYPNPEVYKKFLEFCRETVWSPILLSIPLRTEFEERCRKFYHDKTYSRVKGFFSSRPEERDGPQTINGRAVGSVEDLLNRVPWHSICREAIPVPFHGDLQPENIIVTPRESFTLLDWRQDFGGLLDKGDIYYDLGKLYHALIISGDVIRAGRFSVEGSNFNFDTRHNLNMFRTIFEDFCWRWHYSLYHIRLMTALIYLNLCSLYPDEYGKFLFLLGKYSLQEALEQVWTL